MRTQDTLQRFLFEDHAIRGSLVHLDSTFRAARDGHAYPPAMAHFLGQALAASALLSASIKYHESLILQIQADGPVRLIVAQCTGNRSLRGLVRWTANVDDEALTVACSNGLLVITIDPGGGQERYQGMVQLLGSSLAQAIEAYFAQSEQLRTRLWLAADHTSAAGLFLQRVPKTPADPDAWSRVQQLASTISRQELLELPSHQLFYRLFHEENLRVFESEVVTFRCTCSRERIGRVLYSLGRSDLSAILRQEGQVNVTCEYCNRVYRFDTVDVEQLFVSGIQPQAPCTPQ
ncbi:MAG: Hsp33 family molecular chaperone HslO [Gammaproteobacteria bacterium]